jgi:hypothetical protein
MIILDVFREAALILSTDKTQLTPFQGKMTYLVYLTIGNIPRQKPSQHAQLLIEYIPTTRLEHMKNQTGQQCALANLFHGCMDIILTPIRAYSETEIDMMSSDGVWR